MKHLGLLAGALLGLLLFRHFGGLLLGAAFGFVFDQHRARRRLQRKVGSRDFVEPLFALLGAVAKSDGRVSQDEIDVAERMMQRLQLDTRWRRRAIAAFNRGKQPQFDLVATVTQLRDWTDGSRDLAYPMLDVLVDTVLAEGVPSPAKLSLLQQVARALNFSELQLMAMLAMKAPASARRPGAGGWRPGGNANGNGGRGNSRQGPAAPAGIADPYAVLGLTRSADDATIKRAYRKLMSEHHPDRLGDLPDDLRRRAVERASAINAAYDQIKHQRGIK